MYTDHAANITDNTAAIFINFKATVLRLDAFFAHTDPQCLKTGR
jgi:hypothetical protein